MFIVVKGSLRKGLRGGSPVVLTSAAEGNLCFCRLLYLKGII